MKIVIIKLIKTQNITVIAIIFDIRISLVAASPNKFNGTKSFYKHANNIAVPNPKRKLNN